MTMQRSPADAQASLWIETRHLADTPGHPFYVKLAELLRQYRVDEEVEALCEAYYADTLGRPSIPPGVYFRMLMIGYFEGLDSERGIAWRTADSLSLRQFLGYPLGQATPDHSSLSRIRHRLPLEVHQAAFAKVLTLLAKENLLKGKTLGVDATTLEANAAMRSIVRRDNGDTYEEFLAKLAQASGIETPTKEDLIRLDRQRKKSCSNKEWVNPHEPDAKIGKMKTGETHLLHKCEKADDLESGAVVAITLQAGDKGDTETGFNTVAEAARNLATAQENPQAEQNMTQAQVLEVVQDKGYHSNDVLVVYDEQKDVRVRTYIAEPKRSRRNWTTTGYAQAAMYANRRRIRSARGKRLFRRRAEICERGFAHLFTTGGMRRTHLRGHQNILKRLLIHTCGFNLGLVMRKRYGLGTPRGLHDRLAALLALIFALWTRIWRHGFTKIYHSVISLANRQVFWRLPAVA